MTHPADLFTYVELDTELGRMRWPGHHEEIGVTPGVQKYGYYNSEENQVIESWLEKPSRRVFVDVGAHVGWFSRLAGSYKHTKVIAIEPSLTNYSMLVYNMSQWEDSVLINAAAWDKVEILPINLSWHNSGDHRVFDHDDDQPIKGLGVLGIPLDHLVQHADVVKIDTQGCDHRVLKGMRRIIKENHPKILCEFSPHHIKRLGDDPEEVLEYVLSLPYDISYVGSHDAEFALKHDNDCTFMLI